MEPFRRVHDLIVEEKEIKNKTKTNLSGSKGAKFLQLRQN